jgi:hypothetical protein
MNEAASIQYSACNDKMLSEWLKTKKQLEGSSCGQIWDVILYPKGIKKDYEHLSQDSQCPARYLNKGPPDYKTGVLYFCLQRAFSLSDFLLNQDMQFRIITEMDPWNVVGYNIDN